jgi:hypothetical protein
MLFLARFGLAAAIVSNEGNLASGFRGSLMKRPSRLGTGPLNLKCFVPVERYETMNLISYRSEDLPGAGGMSHRPRSFKSRVVPAAQRHEHVWHPESLDSLTGLIFALELRSHLQPHENQSFFAII